MVEWYGIFPLFQHFEGSYFDTAADPRMREIGTINRENVKRLFTALALYPFTQKLRMSLEEVQELSTRAAQEADTPRLKAYFPV